jgi:hypothetical protein
MESNQTALVRRSHSSKRSALLLAYGTATRRTILEELYDREGGVGFAFLFMVAGRECGTDLYLKNERKLAHFLCLAKQKIVWTRLMSGGRAGHLFYESRNVREFHRWVYVNDLLVKPEFDPKAAANIFAKEWQYESVFRELLPPKLNSIKKPGARRGDLAKALIALDAADKSKSNRDLKLETFTITYPTRGQTKQRLNVHSKKVYDVFRKHLPHRLMTVKKK